jgi:hypothetical protein
MRTPVEIDDDLDCEYLERLIRTRARPRTKNVFSPSGLSQCVRKVYFNKTNQKKFPVDRIQSSGYFLDGNFRHFKWQFVMWKMHRAGIIKLIGNENSPWSLGAEVWVGSKSGDYGGT